MQMQQEQVNLDEEKKIREAFQDRNWNDIKTYNRVQLIPKNRLFEHPIMGYAGL